MSEAVEQGDGDRDTGVPPVREAAALEVAAGSDGRDTGVPPVREAAALEVAAGSDGRDTGVPPVRETAAPGDGRDTDVSAASGTGGTPVSQSPVSMSKKFRPLSHKSREHRRRRLRRRGRRVYVRSVYFLPSLATLGNAICGFGSMYVASLTGREGWHSPDALTQYFATHSFLTAAYLIFFAMIFDALDGRLARYTRHTTDFGGQLDSLADVVSFGCAPAFLALQLFKFEHAENILPAFSRLVWAIGALYMSCAAMRLARFNVSNEKGEQAHFSFLGLPSPGAGGAIAGWVLLQQELRNDPWRGHLMSTANFLASACTWLLPLLVLGLGLLMISHIRYGHMVNRYLRGKRSIARLMFVVALLLLIYTAHRYVVAIGALGYAFAGLFGNLYLRVRRMRMPGR